MYPFCCQKYSFVCAFSMEFISLSLPRPFFIELMSFENRLCALLFILILRAIPSSFSSSIVVYDFLLGLVMAANALLGTTSNRIFSEATDISSATWEKFHHSWNAV